MGHAGLGLTYVLDDSTLRGFARCTSQEKSRCRGPDLIHTRTTGGTISDGDGLEETFGPVWPVRNSSEWFYNEKPPRHLLPDIPPMIRYGSRKVLPGNPVCLSPKMNCSESGRMYDRAPSQSESEGLKPYFAPSHRISKLLPLEALGSWIVVFEGDNESALVGLRPGARFVVWPSMPCNGAAKVAKASNRNTVKTKRMNMIWRWEFVKKLKRCVAPIS